MALALGQLQGLVANPMMRREAQILPAVAINVSARLSTLTSVRGQPYDSAPTEN